jgi:uncharacterized protein (DUF433 family)
MRGRLETQDHAMVELPASQYIEKRSGGYSLAGIRISLDSIAWAVRRGETVAGILADFPVLKSGETLAGAVEFLKAHPKEIKAYLAEQARNWEEARRLNPPGLVERVRRFREERKLRTV